MKELIKTLCAVDGVSGYEDNVRAIIQKMIAPHVEKMTIDAMGNLIALKRGKKPSQRRLLICAHTDEIGALVFRITERGLIKLVAVGTLDPRVILGQRVRIGKNNIRGVVAIKAIQLTSEAEKRTLPALDSMYVDIGAKSKYETDQVVRIGDPVAFDNQPSEFGQDRLRAKAIDDRIGCAVMVTLIREELPYDTWFAFSTCEEVGLRGAAALTERVQPDCTIVLEGTSAGDIPGVGTHNHSTYQGGGAVVSLADGGTIYNRTLIEMMTQAADRAGIRWQYRRGNSGRTDSGSIHARAGGSLTFGVSVPTRYIHSANNVLYLPDSMAALDLTRLFIQINGGIMT